MPTTSRPMRILSLAVCGIGLGILLGISISPVIQSVLSGILALVVAVTGVLAGIERTSVETKSSDTSESSDKVPAESTTTKSSEESPTKESESHITQTHIDPSPVAGLVLGIVLGSLLGIYIRTNELLSPDLNHFVHKWKKTGLSEAELTRRLFDQIYGAEATKTDSKPQPSTSDMTPEALSSLAKSGLNDPQIVRLVFERLTKAVPKTPDPASKDKEKEKSSAPEAKPIHSSVLFTNVAPEECRKFRNNLDDLDELREVMITGKNRDVSEFAKKCKDPEDLKLLVEVILCPSRKP